MTLELQGTNAIAWNDVLPAGLVPEKVFFGRDVSGEVGEVQIAVARSDARPTKALLDAAWKTRGAGSAMPVMVVAESGGNVWLLGPSETSPMLGPIPTARAQLLLQSILNEADGIAARTQALSIVNSLESTGDAGFTNQFLFASHYLHVSVPQRKDWEAASAAAQSMLSQRGTSLVNSLGFESAPLVGDNSNALILRTQKGSRRAVAVLLDENEAFDKKSVLYQISPVAHGLELASREEVPWVIVMRASTLRLYPGRDGVGVGQRGQSETYFELNLNHLSTDFAGLLPLIFSANALESGGSAEQILEESGRYAADLGSRLRDRVYEGVVPAISVAIAEQLPKLGYEINAEGLKIAYALTLRVLFRLLFQAYGEDTGLLPVNRNEGFRGNSLQTFIERYKDEPAESFSPDAKTIWFDLAQVWDAIYNGAPHWSIPAYGGSLFDPTEYEGELLTRLWLPDAVMGPALQNLLSEITSDGVRGAVDFRSLQVREFGTIYEGLLESSLSVAESDLIVDAAGAYVPAKEGQAIVVQAGRPYFHSASGDRKATGSYYTPKIIVDHLIERSVTPTLDAHLAKVRELIDAGKDRKAAELFWDFRVADLAMGSAHFLVAAVDKIERGMRDFLTVTPIDEVRNELQRLSDKAREALGNDREAAEDINDAQLLRRQVARRCVYGLDINPLAVELSRLAIWIHTFVPGLPMSSLDHNLVLGNSLTGIGTVDEALDALGLDGLFTDFVREPLESARRLLDDVADADEADKAEVDRTSRLLADVRIAAQPAKNVFDAAVATRLGVVKAAAGFSQLEIDEIAGSPEARAVLDDLNCAHLPFLFPEVFMRENPGFDVLVGNPPWEKLHVEEHQWWGLRIPRLRSLPKAQREAALSAFQADRPDLMKEYLAEIEIVRNLNLAVSSGPFPGLGAAHLDLYQAFAWRFWLLGRSGGKVGMVLPRGALSGAGLAEWRRDVLREGSFAEVCFVVNNKHWVFENVDGRYTVGLTVLERGDTHVARFCGPFANESDFVRGATDLAEISAEEFESWSSTSAFALIPDPTSAEVFQQMKNSPRFDEATPDWEFRPLQGDFNATSDKQKFSFDISEANGRVPVLAGASFNLWAPDFGDPYAYSDVNDVRPALAEKLDRAVKTARSAYFGLSFPKGQLPMDRARIAFRDVTTPPPARTTIACLLPPGVVFTHKAPVIVRRAGSARDEAHLLGVLSSIPFDWYMRRWVELTMSFELLSNAPIPHPISESPISGRIAEIAGRLAAVDQRYRDWADDVGVEVGTANDEPAKSDLIAELDALVSLLYGLSEDQVEHVFSTFHRGWNYQPRLDAVLAHYAAWKDKT